ncbi:MAG: lipoyl synthase [Clostridiales Family XIII bacterium]|jgi:lipoic acid synthetase|nr:lipoyl synthase [Clostridiales Family XIII bacterium]
MQKKPDWLRKKLIIDPNQDAVFDILRQLDLNTVCREANCPNSLECHAAKTATFMILGTKCTRNCTFCNVAYGSPDTPDPLEPEHVADAVSRLGLRYAVVTSVTRDDIPDGGARRFAETIKAIRRREPKTAIEVLIPDFRGNDAALSVVADAAPDVISHNMETVKALYPEVRPQADYGRSLDLIRKIRCMNPNIKSKSGIMLGLGETKEQVLEALGDLIGAGCAFLTVGQYLAPSPAHHAVCEYIRPEVFEEYKLIADKLGFEFTASAPFVRSSYRAGEAMGFLEKE